MSVNEKLSRLSLELKTDPIDTAKKQPVLKAAEPTPDSWEDETDDEDTPVEAPGPSLKHTTSNDQSPDPPPPTPISPTSGQIPARHGHFGLTLASSERPSSRGPLAVRENGEKRPEKTTATANRMIAGALGLKAPKKTEEQRQYDRALKEAEIRRRNREKEEQERGKVADEKAKASVWDN